MLCSQKNNQIILVLELFSSLSWYRKCACSSSISQAMLQVRNFECSPSIHAPQIPITRSRWREESILVGVDGLGDHCAWDGKLKMSYRVSGAHRTAY